MFLLPEDPLAVVALAVMVAGTVFVAVSRWPKAYSLGLLLLVVFALQFYGQMMRGLERDPLTGEATPDLLISWLGFRAEPFLSGNQWWSPFSYMFLHSGLTHIIGNLFILLTAGPVLEDRMGSRAFLWTYFLAGFAAAAVHLLLATVGPDPFVGPTVAAVGASGAIFGILTAVAVLYPKERLPMTLVYFIIWLPASIVLLIYSGFNIAYALGDYFATERGIRTGIAWYGHFAGLAVGLLAGLILERRRPADAPSGGGPPAPVDIAKLEPLATTPDLRDMLTKIEGLQGATRDDAAFREAWLDRFFRRARCPQSGDPLTRKGQTAECVKCGYRVDFSGKKAGRKLF
ncbi:MAG TPA: rhomboid family intramembrane serine protease [Candidatus Thermoplasmatota archaeon]|nr:rhomboid family intramembrane serine protease [Candidatus Thermoplasmatota archaeon]